MANSDRNVGNLGIPYSQLGPERGSLVGLNPLPVGSVQTPSSQCQN